MCKLTTSFVLLLISTLAFAATLVPLQQAQPNGWRSVSCVANTFDAQGVNVSGACEYVGVASGSGRGGGYVKPPLSWSTASWDLFGNLTLGVHCGSRAKWTSNTPPVVYEAGFNAANCNSNVLHQTQYFLGTYYWTGPSLAGEYILSGQTLYLP